MNTLRCGQNGRHVVDVIFKYIFLKRKSYFDFNFTAVWFNSQQFSIGSVNELTTKRRQVSTRTNVDQFAWRHDMFPAPTGHFGFKPYQGKCMKINDQGNSKEALFRLSPTYKQQSHLSAERKFEITFWNIVYRNGRKHFMETIDIIKQNIPYKISQNHVYF